MSYDNDSPQLSELVQDLFAQFNRKCRKAGDDGKAGLVISDKTAIEAVFDRVKQFKSPQFAEAFQLLPYINGEDQDYSNRIVDILKQVIHLAGFFPSLSEQVIAAVSADFYAWSDYFSLDNLKKIVKEETGWREIFVTWDLNQLFNSISIYEAVVAGNRNNHSLLHDTAVCTTEENHIFSEYKHLLKIKRTVVVLLLRSLTNRYDNAEEASKAFNDLESFVGDLNYLGEFTRKDDPVHVVEEEFAIYDKYDNTPDYCITDKNTVRHILDMADLSVRKGRFDNKVFVMLPYIKVTDLHVFRIQQFLKSALSPASNISQESFAFMMINLERWLPYLTTEHIKYLINISVVVHGEEEAPNNICLEFKQVLTVMNILEHVAYRKFFHPIYLENLLFSVLNKLVKDGRKIYIRRMAVVASLNIHCNLFRNHPDLYDGYHPYFYDNLLVVLICMQKLWNENSYLCDKMLQTIRGNEQLFGINASEFESQQEETLEDVEWMVEKIREGWISSVRLSVI